jgi:hypothetical protein
LLDNQFQRGTCLAVNTSVVQLRVLGIVMVTSLPARRTQLLRALL